MAMPGHAARAASDPRLGLAGRLEAHRDIHFRRLSNRRVTGPKSALRFIEEVGFCTAFSAGLGLPCMREAVAGEREPVLPEHIQHDYAIGMCWELKDVLPARRRVYYGKVLAGRPSFISLELLPAFLRLRLEPGGYRAMYQQGMLSLCAKLVMDALSRRGPAETRALKLSSGCAQASKRPIFDRAMKELQEKFLALKVEERYDPFTYVWDTLERRWDDALAAARALGKTEAASKLVERYYEVAAYGNERAVARILALPQELVERAARRLERQGRLVRGQRVAGLPGDYSLLAEYCP